jgi:hypothetical protein
VLFRSPKQLAEKITNLGTLLEQKLTSAETTLNDIVNGEQK